MYRSRSTAGVVGCTEHGQQLAWSDAQNTVNSWCDRMYETSSILCVIGCTKHRQQMALSDVKTLSTVGVIGCKNQTRSIIGVTECKTKHGQQLA